MASMVLPAPKIMASRRRKPCWSGTPEVYFYKSIDNSRLVKVADPKRKREVGLLLGALCCLFLIVMTYAWQHFSAIEYGYRIEALKSQRDGLVELNRTLRLEESSLRDPGRIDALARQMGLQSPQAGQVMLLDSSTADGSGPVMARATAVSVISAQ